MAFTFDFVIDENTPFSANSITAFESIWYVGSDTLETLSSAGSINWSLPTVDAGTLGITAGWSFFVGLNSYYYDPETDTEFIDFDDQGTGQVAMSLNGPTIGLDYESFSTGITPATLTLNVPGLLDTLGALLDPSQDAGRVVLVDGNYNPLVFTINLTINDVNEAPTISNLSSTVNVNENVAGTVTSFTLADPDQNSLFQSNTLAVSDSRFEVVPTATAGVYDLRLINSLDYEALTDTTFDLTITATDATNSQLTTSKIVTVNVININDAPTAIAFSDTTPAIAETANTTNRTKVADISIVDDGIGTNVLSLAGADAALFEIEDSVLYLKAGTVLNYESGKTSYTVTVNVNDAVVRRTTPDASRAFTLTLTDGNEAPIAQDDTEFTALAGATKAISIAALLRNDADPDANPNFNQLSITSVSSNNGTVTMSGGNILFTPTNSGTAVFTYTLSDNGGLTDTATVAVNVGTTFNGGNGRDLLTGTLGDDVLLGGNGEDTIAGGAGDDLINGGNGADLLTGGWGSDRFVITRTSGGDIITDFTDGTDVLTLAGGLSAEQLTIASSNGNTLIRFGNTTLATLTGVSANVINTSDFVTI